DAQGNIYVTGYTTSTNFPLVHPLQPTFGGGPSDAFVAKLNPAGSQLLYSTYLGGAGSDWASDIAVDRLGNMYVTGKTDSSDFPTVSPVQDAYGGGGDAFVTKLNASGAAIVYSTFLGGRGFERGLGIAVDDSGATYVVGDTGSADFPAVNAFQLTY